MNQKKYADGSTEQFQYDGDGNVLQKTTRSGQTIVLTYDALNRLSTKTATAETAGETTYGYDLTGRLLQASDGSSTTPYSVGYDTAGRATSYTDQQGRNTQAQFDGVGNRTRVQWPANTSGVNAYSVTYSYDALNRMTEIDANGSSATPLAKYQWDALSRQTQTTFGDGTSDTLSQYDGDDNLLSLTENFAGGTNVTFTYTYLQDRQRQSTSLSTSAFQYVPAPGTTNYAQANPDNTYPSVGSTTLTYDTNRNLTYDGFNTLAYDAENRLIQAQNAQYGLSQYFYDPLGNRKEKIVGGAITQFVLLGDQEIADYSGSGTGTAQILTVRGVSGLPVAGINVSTGGVTYYHHDALGSTVSVTQAGTSGPAEIYTYSDFGVPGSGNWAIYRFAGYRYDPETGLYYLKARYYSPQLGRFLQSDPVGFVGGSNLYVYAKNNPINRIDPFGTSDNPTNGNDPGVVVSVGFCDWVCIGITWNTNGSWYLYVGVGTPGVNASIVGTNSVEGYSGGWTLSGGLDGYAGGFNDSSVGVGVGTPGVSLTYGIPLSDALTFIGTYPWGPTALISIGSRNRQLLLTIRLMDSEAERSNLPGNNNCFLGD